MTDQTSKVVKAVTDAKDIGFNEGLGRRVDDIANQFEGIQIDFHNSKLKLTDTARENQIMNTDFKNAAKHLEANTQTINKELVPSIRALIQYLGQGIKYNPVPVAKDLYQVFSNATGKTVDQVISTEIKNKLVDVQVQTQKADLDAKLQAEYVKDVMSELTDVLREFKHELNKLVNQYLIEFVVIFGLTILTPGWYKILTLLFATLISLLFNKRNNMEE